MINTGHFPIWGPAFTRLLLIFLLLAPAVYSQDAPPQTPGPLAFLSDMKTAFDAANKDAWLQAFAPELRANEGLVYDSLRNTFLMTRVVFRPVGNPVAGDNGETVFVHVAFRNDQESMLETWKLVLAAEGERRIIRSKTNSGNPAIYYDMTIPSSRAVRVARLEIKHHDLEAVFENAWIFYDNLTQMETGMVVVGSGRLRFTPSSETERHQLSLRYKTGAVNTGVISAFLRFSPMFFESNVKITPITESGPAPGMPAVESALARNLFNRFYGDTFSVYDPVEGRLLATVPQSDQVTFEFQTEGRSGFGYSYNPFSLEEVRFWSRTPDHLLCLYSPEIPGETGRRMIISFAERYDLVRCDVDLDIQPDRFFLSAKARLEVAARIPGVEELKLDLNAAFEILRVSDSEGRPLSYTQDKDRNLLTVALLEPLDKGASTTIEVFYRGVLQPPVQTTDIAQVIPYMGLSEDEIPKFDSYLYSQSASWYPSSTQTDFFQSRLRISVPPLYSCVAVGELATEETIDQVSRVLTLEKIGNKLSTFETRQPVKYLAFIVGMFKRALGTTDESARPPIRLFVSEDIRIVRRSLAEEARSILETYEGIFGPYPFEKLTVIQRVWGTAGGHSPASFIVLNELAKNLITSSIPDPKSPVDLPQYKEFFMAHEIAHQWWGQVVTGASYHDQWLSEGVAQYAAIRYLKEKYGQKAFVGIMKKMIEWTEKMSVYGPVTLGVRLSAHDYKAFQAILYGKSAVVLFLLSDLIGQEAFDRGLRAFLEKHAFGTARTAQFIEEMEASSGRSLREFFRGWFDFHLLPKAETTTQALRRGDGYEFKITVKQLDRPMVFPLIVTWEENGRPVRQVLEVDGPIKTFTFTSKDKPARFAVDPDRLVPGDVR